jgi:CBS domain-containing protein
MTERRIRHLPVREAGRLAGVVTIGDLLAYQVSEQGATIAQMTSYLYDLR